MNRYMPIDEKAFGMNDIFLLCSIAVSYSILLMLPKRFPRSVMLLLLFFGPTAACVMDDSIGGGAFDLYDIMDGPRYTIMDLVAYTLYAPFGYFFIYFYDRLRLNGWKTVLFISISSLLSIVFEWLCMKAGVFHYKHHYSIAFSFPIYLVTQTGLIQFYHYIRKP